ncbi:MAG: hypothetical protein V1742_07930 [Pseudomonadota bacterium]
MKSKTKAISKRPWLALETVIIVGLVLKVTLTLAFIFLFGAPGFSPWLPNPAHAQEQKQPDKDKPAEAPAPSPSGKTTPDRDKQPDWLNEALRTREKALVQRETRLNQREKALEELEKKLNERMVEIEAQRKKLAELVERQQQLVEQQKILRDERIEHLVNAYKAMRPEQAGVLVNNLDDAVAVAILSAMPGRSAGQILANVEPAKAARLTKAISEARKKNEEKEAKPPTSTPTK